MNKLEFVKTGIGLVVSLGVGAIVGNAVKLTSPSNMKTMTKFCVNAGGFVLTALASDMASKYTEDNLNSTIDMFKNMVKVEDAIQEVEEEA